MQLIVQECGVRGAKYTIKTKRVGWSLPHTLRDKVQLSVAYISRPLLIAAENNPLALSQLFLLLPLFISTTDIYSWGRKRPVNVNIALERGPG